MLGGAASPEHRDASGLHFFFFVGADVVPVGVGVVPVVGVVGVVGVVVVIVVVGVVGATYLPTTIVTVLPFLAWVVAAGFWLRTTPFWLWLVTVCGCWVAGNPAAPSAALAAPVVLPTTFGTATVAGALATTRVTVEPLGADLPPVGVWLMHGARGGRGRDLVGWS